MTNPFSPDDLLPFSGYRPVRVGARGGFERQRPELVASIEHFFQAERFRGTDEGLRRAILEANTAKQARKLAQRKSAIERPGWERLQWRVMRTALWMKLREHPELARRLMAHPEIAEGAYSYRDHFWGAHRAGVSRGNYEKLLTALRERLASGTSRVVVTGGTDFSNAFLMDAKLRSIFRRAAPDVLLIGCRKGAEDLAEHWAITQALPVRHIPPRGRRSSSERGRHARALLAPATHLVAFGEGDAQTRSLVQSARSRGCAVRVIRGDSTRGSTRDGASLHRLR